MTAVSTSPGIYILTLGEFVRLTHKQRKTFVRLPCKISCPRVAARKFCEFLRHPCKSLANLHGSCTASCGSRANMCLYFLTFKVRTPWDSRTCILLLPCNVYDLCWPVMIYCEFVYNRSVYGTAVQRNHTTKNRMTVVTEALAADQNLQKTHFGLPRMERFFICTMKTDDWMDAQADLSLCWPHMSEGSFLTLRLIRCWTTGSKTWLVARKHLKAHCVRSRSNDLFS